MMLRPPRRTRGDEPRRDRRERDEGLRWAASELGEHAATFDPTAMAALPMRSPRQIDGPADAASAADDGPRSTRDSCSIRGARRIGPVPRTSLHRAAMRLIR
jgi:hypothetical protein